MDALGDGTIFKGHHLDAEQAASVAAAQLALHFAAFKAHHRNRPQTRDVYERAERVGAVIRGVHEIAPVVGIAVGNARPDGLAIVDVFALAVFKFADFSFAVQFAHLVGAGHVAIVFSIGIDFPGLLHAFDQIYRFFIVCTGSTSLNTCLPAFRQRMANGACSLA